MNNGIKNQVEYCIAQLRKNSLSEADLEKIVQIAQSESPQQDLLYIQTNRTSPTSPVIGMRIIENGNISDGPPDPSDWPYETVLDAIRDGWRVIKFPEQALMLDETRTYGLGAEFVLER